LTKVFRDFWRRPKVRAVDGLDLEILRGEVFGLLGPNGSGKSTTIKMLLGLLHPTHGVIRVLDASPQQVQVKARIGFLPEDSCLYPHLTARETLDFFGRLFGLDARARRRRTATLLDMVELTHAADRLIGEFSKGMARRIGLAQALINEPDLLILDEPTAGLDPIGCRQVKDLILSLAKSGKTVVLSSHLLADVEDVCDRIAILHNGRIRARGRVRELLERRGQLQLTLPSLPPEATSALLRLIREQFGREPEVRHPLMDLERFFLDVIEQASRSTGPSTPLPDHEPPAHNASR
jgi:ABC-2 type transport system ATP-binding protein